MVRNSQANPSRDPELQITMPPLPSDIASVAQSSTTAPLAGKSFIRRIAGGTFHYGFGQSLPQILRFLLIPIYTSVLTAEDYGLLELAATMTAFLFVAMRLGVPGAVTRYYFDQREGASLRNYVTTIAWFLLASSLIVGSVVLTVWPWMVEPMLPGLTVYPYGLLIVAGSVIACGQNLQDRLVQAREQSSYAARLALGRASVSIPLALLFVVVFRMHCVGLLLADLLVATVFAVQSLRYLWPELQGHFQCKLLWSSLTYAVSILPAHLLGVVSPLITRSFLAHVDTLAALGNYSLATRFVSPLDILVTAFAVAFNPVYFSVREERSPESLHKLAHTARNVWLAAVTCALAVALLGPPVILIITPARFHTAATLLPILTLGFLGQALYTLIGPEIFYSKKTWLVPVASACAATATVTVTICTVERFGPLGLAWATVIGSAVMALVSAWISGRLVKVPHEWRHLLRVAACGGFMFGVSMLAASENPWILLVTNATLLVVFPGMLWIAGDPSIRQAVGWVRQ